MNKQQLLTKLAPYLPYRITIDVPVWQGKNQITETGIMIGLYKYIQFDFESGVIQYSIEGNTYNAVYPTQQPKPHLRPFSHLTIPIQHNGEEVIPAVEVASLAFDVLSISEYEFMHLGLNDVLEVTTEEGCLEVNWNYNIRRLYKHQYGAKDGPVVNQVAIIDLLRSMHFAVGFEEGEYIPISTTESPEK